MINCFMSLAARLMNMVDLFVRLSLHNFALQNYKKKRTYARRTCKNLRKVQKTGKKFTNCLIFSPLAWGDTCQSMSVPFLYGWRDENPPLAVSIFFDIIFI